LIGDAAKEVSEKAGVSEATVKRDGARVEALEKCTKAVQKGIESKAFTASDAEIKTLSKLAPGDQDAVATDLRKGQADSVKESMKVRGIKTPAPPKKKAAKKKPPKKLDKKAYYKQWDKAIGPVMRVLDKIANGVGEKDGPSHKAILGQLEAATDEMAEWMGVE
jgi:hypothetical protein